MLQGSSASNAETSLHRDWRSWVDQSGLELVFFVCLLALLWVSVDYYSLQWAPSFLRTAFRRKRCCVTANNPPNTFSLGLICCAVDAVSSSLKTKREVINWKTLDHHLVNKAWEASRNWQSEPEHRPGWGSPAMMSCPKPVSASAACLLPSGLQLLLAVPPGRGVVLSIFSTFV